MSGASSLYHQFKGQHSMRTQRFTVNSDLGGDDSGTGAWDMLEEIARDRPAWMTDSRRHCRGYNVDAFYGDNKGVMICEGCPVQQQCLDYAIENERFGTWGGMSERQRRLLRKNQLKSAKDLF